MFDKRKAKKIKRDLESRWPDAQFEVAVMGDDVSVHFLGGNNHIDEYPAHEQAVAEMVKVIRKTIPDYEWKSYQGSDGQRVYAG